MSSDRLSVPRAILTAAGAMVLQLAFIGSYLGGLHQPLPRHVPIAVVGTADVATPVLRALRSYGAAVRPEAVPTQDEAVARIRDRMDFAAYVPDPDGGADLLLVSTAASPAIEQTAAAAARYAVPAGRTLEVTDTAPFLGTDPLGLTGFALVSGWVVGGFLLASLLGFGGARRPMAGRAITGRCALLVCYAALIGAASAAFAGPLTHLLDRGLPRLAGVGALVVLGTAAGTAALEALFGLVGTGLAVTVLAVLGNPTSSGAHAAGLVPGFWRLAGSYLPPGAGTVALRETSYFDGAGLRAPLTALGCAAGGGLLVLVAAASWRLRRAGGVVVPPAEPGRRGRHEAPDDAVRDERLILVGRTIARPGRNVGPPSAGRVDGRDRIERPVTVTATSTSASTSTGRDAPTPAPAVSNADADPAGSEPTGHAGWAAPDAGLVGHEVHPTPATRLTGDAPTAVPTAAPPTTGPPTAAPPTAAPPTTGPPTTGPPTAGPAAEPPPPGPPPADPAPSGPAPSGPAPSGPAPAATSPAAAVGPADTGRMPLPRRRPSRLCPA